MNFEQYERRARIHQAYAQSLTDHFGRLWARSLTDAERATIDSGTICCTFMRLELLESRLASTSTASVADEVFGYVAADVAQSRTEVVRAMTTFAVGAGVPMADLDSENLLTFELELLERHKERASKARG